MLQAQGLDQIVLNHLKIDAPQANMTEWTALVERVKSLKNNVEIAIVGKYVALHDAYLSIAEALRHAGIMHDSDVTIRWVDAEEVNEANVAQSLQGVHGILVPGGFGDRGIEGKITAIRYARENKVPFFGICLGMQVAVIEYARNVLGLVNANSSEINASTPYPVIDLLPDQKDIADMGGTMRLGLYPCKVVEGTNAHVAYNDELVYERHRHRYEFNNEYREALEEAGLVISGTSPDGRLVEMVEVKEHPWFLAVQFHPEFTSRPNRPQPLFSGFVEASLKQQQ